MEKQKMLGLVLVSPFADWEFGFLAGSAREWFGADVVFLTPDGGSVISIGGLSASGSRGFDAAGNADLDAVAVIGSDTWTDNAAPDVGPLLHAVRDRGGVVAGICAGTVALARAGLFEGHAHTSNGRDWLGDILGSYPGNENYKDVPNAVTDGGMISAPGSAPGTFACAVLQAVYPDKAEQIGQMRAMLAQEYGSSGSA